MKNLFLGLALFVSLNLFAQAPANNTCGGAVPLLSSATTCVTTAGTMANATLDAGASTTCPGVERCDVWYRFTAKSPNPTITLNVTGVNFANPGLQVLTGCTGTSMACGTNSVNPTNLTVNTTYYLRVFSTAATIPTSNAGFTVCIVDPAPANDLCTNATNLTPTAACGATTGQTLGFATATGSPASPYSTTNDVWYRFTTPATVNTVNIALSGIPGATDINTSNNTYIEVFNANDCSLVTEANSLGVSNANTGLTLLNAAASTQYYFRVFTRMNPTSNTSRWSYSICVSYQPVPTNNECATAIALTPGITNTTGRVNNATASSGITLGCATGTPDDVVTLTGIDTDGDGLDNRFDNNNSAAEVTSARMGNGGTVTGDPTPGSVTTVQNTVFLYGCPTERDWRCLPYILSCEFVSFKAVLNNKRVQLDWSALCRQEISHFIVERSTDRVHFTQAFVTAGKPVLNEVESYTGTDDINGLDNEMIYYRLKSIMKSGRELVSNIIAVRQGNGTAAGIKVLPNPVKDLLQISLQVQQNTIAGILIMDASGRILYRFSENLLRGSNTLAYTEAATLPEGMYFIRVELEGKQLISKFNKLK